MNKGDVLKLNQKGLDWISAGSDSKKNQLATLRFQYLGRGKKYKDTLSVKRIGTKNRHESYHESFLEIA